MSRLSYLMLLAIAVPVAAYADSAHADPAQPAPAVADPVSAPASADAAHGDTPRAAPRGDAIAKLKNFIANTHSAQASFTQELLDRNGKRIQAASGTMQFTRPGKFRWTYDKPYEQVRVGDGVKFWLYDVDLNQVTVKKLDAALGSSPAALLAGSNEIEKGFALKDAGCEPRAGMKREQAASQVAPQGVAGEDADACSAEKGGRQWLEAKPYAPDASFESIRMAFNAKSELVIMELRDAFGHVTVLRFSDMLINPKFPRELFKFEPPKGADVLGDE